MASKKAKETVHATLRDEYGTLSVDTYSPLPATEVACGQICASLFLSFFVSEEGDHVTFGT